jgi:hypothetical protein
MYPLDPKQLSTAGKAARVSAVLGLISLLLHLTRPMLIESHGSSLPDTLLMIVSFVGVGLLMLIYHTFQAYLNQRFEFFEADLHIKLLIWLNIALALLAFANIMLLDQQDLQDDKWPVGVILTILLMIFLGLVVMVLATKVARLQDELFGMMKPYYICLKVSGICIALVFTAPVGVIFSAASDLVLSKVFFKAAEEMGGSGDPGPK